MGFINILVIVTFALVCVLFVGVLGGVLGYAIFSPVTAESIRKLKKELEIKP